MTELSLASEFSQPTRDNWLALVDRVLKGDEFDSKLVFRTADGLRVEPLYPKAEGAVLTGRADAGPWRVVQRVDHPDADAAREQALADLEGGADALALVFAGAPSSRGFGLQAADAGALDRALRGTMLDLISVRVDAGAAGARIARLLLDVAEARGHELRRLDLDLGIDPIGAVAASGAYHLWDGERGTLRSFLREARGRGVAGPVALADGRPYHEAGCSEAEELAAVLATAVAYLRAFEADGRGLDEARGAISAMLVCDSDQFLTVAKLRAFRRLWMEVETACGLPAAPIRLHTETAWRSLTKRDPWVNLLRGTVAALAAGIGGADSVTVLPFTAALGLPDAFARRLARNSQAILIEESNLWRVTDPMAGAGGIEALTDGLADEAWSRFQAIEREGGIVESLRTGALPGRIAETRRRRGTALATRRAPITGTSEFPDIREAPVAVLAPAVPSPPRPACSLPSERLAEPYETLRDRSDAIAQRTGRRPGVFLANLGPIAAFSARTTFARNAFEAGGIEAQTNDGFPDLDAMAHAFAGSGCRIACLCSSDEIYVTQAESAASLLRDRGATRIYLAGRPGGAEDTLRAAGVAEFVFVGCDLLRLLSRALDAASTVEPPAEGH